LVGSSHELRYEEYAEKTHLSSEELKFIVEAFYKHGNKKGDEITREKYQKVMSEVSKKFPNGNFTTEGSEFCFDYFDANHTGKVDLLELIQGVSVVARGTTQEKAEQVFRTIDYDDDGYITVDELKKYIDGILALSKKVNLQQFEKETFLGRSIVRGVLLQKEAGIKADLFEEIFQCDKNADRQISLEEWTQAVETNEAIRKLLDPLGWNILKPILAQELKKLKDQNS